MIGLLGLPVFSSFNAGLSAFGGPTGGFLIGFILIGLIYMVFEPINFKKEKFNKYKKLSVLMIGLLACYLCGVLWMVFVLQLYSISQLGNCLMVAIVPFIIPDFIKLVLAYFIYQRIYKYQ